MIVIYGLISMIAFGYANGYATKPIDNAGILATILYRDGLVLLVLLPFAWNDLQACGWSIHYAASIGIGLIQALAICFFFSGLALTMRARGNIGILTAISGSFAFPVIIYAAFFLKEPLPWHKMILVLLSILGIFLLLADFKRDNKLLRSGLLGLASMILFVLFYILFPGNIAAVGVFPALVHLEIGMVLFATIILVLIRILRYTNTYDKGFGKLIFQPLHKASLLRLTRKKGRKQALFLGFITSLAMIGLSLGLQEKESVALMSLFAAAAPLITTLYGRLHYGQKMNVQQSIGIGIVVIAIALLSIT